MISSTFAPVRDLLAPRRPACRAPAQEVRLHLQVAAGHDVVQHRHALEQRDVLERAGDAAAWPRHSVFMPRRGSPRKTIVALLRMVDAVDDVEHRALAGAVGADDGADLVLAHVERDVGQRLDAAERQRDVVQVEDHLAGAARRRRRHAGLLQDGAHAASFTPGLAAGVAATDGLTSRMLQVGADRAPAAILELDLGLDVLRCLAPRTARRSAPRISPR